MSIRKIKYIPSSIHTFSTAFDVEDHSHMRGVIHHESALRWAVFWGPRSY